MNWWDTDECKKFHSKEASEFYWMCPKDPAKNIEFRRKMKEMCAGDEKAQRALLHMCKNDVLFWLNAWGWTYDPRKRPKVIPFVSYPYQDEAILDIQDAILKASEYGIERQDRVIQKSRDMGVSWICDAVIVHQFIFYELSTFLLVSRKEDLVDKKGDPKSLMWKIDLMLRTLPVWMKPNIDRVRLHIGNLDNGSSIDGESTTGDVARGDRRTAIFLDEFASVENGHSVLASTADTTRCRIFNSTPKGVGNAFYDVLQMDKVKKITLHWSKHPEKAKGLYTDADGRLRSPWYDAECEGRSKIEIAQELDIDYLGSSYQFFDTLIMDEIQRDKGREPDLTGELNYDLETLEPLGFVEQKGGRLRLWRHPDPATGSPTPDRLYAMGADIAAGTGSSNSVISIGDCLTGEKIAEFASAHIQPHELAKMAVALARWFSGSDSKGAFMCWEANGAGRVFGDSVIGHGYRHVYFRKREESLDKKSSLIPGWHNSPDAFRASIEEYKEALFGGHYSTHSLEELKECREYIFDKGKIAHARSLSTADPTGAGANHGDRVVSGILLWKGMKELGSTRIKPEKRLDRDPPVGSMAWRSKLHEQAVREEEYW